MSHSPANLQDQSTLPEYRAAWQATMKLLREGRSFSGRERNCAFWNCQDGTFANVSSVTGLDFADDGRAVCASDWDLDGDVDLWLHNRTGPRLRLLLNPTISPNRSHDSNDDTSATTTSAANRFVAFRLQGTASNRDAIGARIEVSLSDNSAEKQPPLIRCLSAGDGFLSQSSKWVPFGVGQKAKQATVRVRWPNGQFEDFGTVSLNQRYELIEGQGSPQVWRPDRSIPKLIANADANAARRVDASRIILPTPFPLPKITYQSFANGALSKDNREIRANQPTLLTLWASWCEPCVAELSEFAEAGQQLTQHNMRVIALAVDHLDQSHNSQSTAAANILQRIDFPFDAGAVDRESIDKLELAHSILFNRQKPLAVPTSYLLDSQNRICAVYHGPMGVEQLLADLELLQSETSRRDLATRFPGRWLAPQRQILLRAVSRLFKNNGYAEDAAAYLKQDAEALQHIRANLTDENARQQFDQQIAEAYFNLGAELLAANEWSEAAEYFQQAIAANNAHVDSLVNLGSLLAKAKQPQQAIRLLERAVSLDKNAFEARVNLAGTSLSVGRFADALEQYQAALNIRPDATWLHARIARTCLETNQIQSAVPHLQAAIQTDENDFASTLCLAWIQATNPDNALRDGTHATELARRLADMAANDSQRLMAADVLAAAHAENQEFDQAIATLQDAKRLLDNAKRNSNLEPMLRQRLQQFQANEPIRDTDGRYP
ncbi:MAG: ASPIC/UnbV domain-containing protein [Pirellulaceae bacterium]